ncbi:hypothetical protein A2533_01165 [Candidatus Falkowbacteria bacterium RIFOXYD2_FULL_35_9]|uniref:Uncharacterized protein n=1 Tax=Candidatus Falkowbacteria bacterium RIFOXYC2_FULL_36_12 TaxID=1798002 RepID=A0A1F5T330_9BACT|nr:MAG: hypothetical protein A2478_01345 [Candidatus Falkowbacteria bacterium RIFOXYC2_FULL_36_12]OGF34212.1 MAG: hypothetical protein A2223_03660 [Candidatus Falkowbacteria bacterium RIFOXYA2_FULL_35_8]OGF46728.1 MAG: hypothetical protein A2533_01165 [Candidatus Falkowbacteria bacterium RIFOXYD2_FULL_35_9]
MDNQAEDRVRLRLVSNLTGYILSLYRFFRHQGLKQISEEFPLRSFLRELSPLVDYSDLQFIGFVQSILTRLNSALSKLPINGSVLCLLCRCTGCDLILIEIRIVRK